MTKLNEKINELNEKIETLKNEIKSCGISREQAELDSKQMDRVYDMISDDKADKKEMLELVNTHRAGGQAYFNYKTLDMYNQTIEDYNAGLLFCAESKYIIVDASCGNVVSPSGFNFKDNVWKLNSKSEVMIHTDKLPAHLSGLKAFDLESAVNY